MASKCQPVGLALNYRPFALNIPDSDIFSEDQPMVMRGSGKAGVFLGLSHYDMLWKHMMYLWYVGRGPDNKI